MIPRRGPPPSSELISRPSCSLVPLLQRGRGRGLRSRLSPEKKLCFTRRPDFAPPSEPRDQSYDKPAQGLMCDSVCAVLGGSGASRRTADCPPPSTHCHR